MGPGRGRGRCGCSRKSRVLRGEIREMVGTTYGALKLFKAVVFLGAGDANMEVLSRDWCTCVKEWLQGEGGRAGGEAGNPQKASLHQVRWQVMVAWTWVLAKEVEKGVWPWILKAKSKITSLKIYLKFMLPHPVTLSELPVTARSINIVTHLVNSWNVVILSCVERKVWKLMMWWWKINE